MASDDDKSALDPWIESVIERFRGPLVGWLASRGASWREAEELAQDAFAEAWIGRAGFRGDSADSAAVGAWLRAIAFHLHSASLRQQRRRASVPLEERDLSAPVSLDDERRGDLVEAFSRLSAAHQTVLRMHYLEESSTAEVAALLEITPKAAEDRLYQARKALRALLARDARRKVKGGRP